MFFSFLSVFELIKLDVSLGLMKIKTWTLGFEIACTSNFIFLVIIFFSILNLKPKLVEEETIFVWYKHQNDHTYLSFCFFIQHAISIALKTNLNIITQQLLTAEFTYSQILKFLSWRCNNHMRWNSIFSF